MKHNYINSLEDFYSSITDIDNGCKESKTIYVDRNDFSKPRRICAQSLGLKILTGEAYYHRAAFKLAYPDIDIKNKSLSWTCQNTACCNPEHMIVGPSRV